MSTRSTLAIGVAIATFALVGCGGGGGGTTASPAAPGTPGITTTTAAPPAPSTPTATATVPTAPASTTAAPPPACAETSRWGTGTRTADGSSRDALYLVRAGRHDCYDRVVFDVNGPAAAGYVVRYVPVVTADPKGDPLPVAGDAVLEVVIRAPELGTDDAGHQPGQVLARTGDYFYTSRLAGELGIAASRALRRLLRRPEHVRGRCPRQAAVPGLHPARPPGPGPPGRRRHRTLRGRHGPAEPARRRLPRNRGRGPQLVPGHRLGRRSSKGPRPARTSSSPPSSRGCRESRATTRRSARSRSTSGRRAGWTTRRSTPAAHFGRIALPAPHDEAALCELVALLMGERLERDRPLWEFWVIEGLPEGRWAILSKVHHALADGVSAATGCRRSSSATTRRPRPQPADAARPRQREPAARRGPAPCCGTRGTRPRLRREKPAPPEPAGSPGLRRRTRAHRADLSAAAGRPRRRSPDRSGGTAGTRSPTCRWPT